MNESWKKFYPSIENRIYKYPYIENFILMLKSSREFAALIKPPIPKMQLLKFWVPGKRYQHMSDSHPEHEQVRMCLNK